MTVPDRMRSVLAGLDREDLSSRPLARARTLPADWYTDPRFLELDRHSILSRTWQYLGPVASVSQPGQVMLGDIGGEPVIAVRGDDGELRAFFNVCRHRAGPVAVEDGTVAHLRCRYHGWTYALDGRLIACPQFEGVEEFDPAGVALPQLPVAEWCGMVWVTLDPDTPSIGSVIGEIPDHIAPLDLASKRFHHRDVHPVAANWKTYVDNFLEAYHVPMVHPEYSKVIDYKGYHEETGDWWSIQTSPYVDDMDYYEGFRERSGERGGALHYILVFPNTMLNVTDGRLQVNHVRPVTHDHSEVVFDYYYDEMEGGDAERLIEEDVRASDRVQDEDAEICAQVQRRLGSRSYRTGRLSVRRERAVHHFQDSVRRCYRAALDQSMGEEDGDEHQRA